MQIALALYPGFTALDIVGPFQTLVDVPGLDVTFVAETAGPVTDHTGRSRSPRLRRWPGPRRPT